MIDPDGPVDGRPRLRVGLRWAGLAVTALSWLIAAAVLLLQVVRWTGADQDSARLIAVSTMWPLVVLPGLLVVFVALARRLRLLGGAAVLLVAVLVVAWWPAWTGRVGPGPSTALPLRVLALNVQYTQDVGVAVNRQVAAEDPDVVVLTELSPLTLRHLDLRQYPYSYEQPTPGAFGQGIWSRWPITVISVTTVAREWDEVTMPEVSIRTPAGPVRVIQVHPPAPTNAADIRIWKDVLGRLDTLMQQSPDPVIAAGDFNASRWDGVYADLLGGRNGIREASRGRGFAATWPETGTFSVGPLFFPLDHVLISRGIGVRSFRVLRPTGSDHRGVLTNLTVSRS